MISAPASSPPPARRARSLLPRGLFGSIFGWFWALATLIGAAFVAVDAATESRLAVERWREVNGAAFGVYAAAAAETHEDAQAPPSRAFLDDLERRTRIRAFLFDATSREGVSRKDANPNGVSGLREVSGRQSVPVGVRVLAERARRDSQSEEVTVFEPSGGSVLAARAARSPSGRRYILAGEVPPPRGGFWQAEPRVHALRLLCVLGAGGALCWALARHLARPILALRALATRIAGGDLSARADAPLAARRDELGELARDFNGMAARLGELVGEKERLVGAQRRLLADVAHELRSPLARQAVALELARDGAEEQALELELARELLAEELAKEPTPDAATPDTAASTCAASLAPPGPGEATGDASTWSQPPLSASSGAVEAASGGPEQALREVHARIEREIGHLSEMIDRLLMLSRLESGVADTEHSMVDLAALCRAVAGDADFEARPHKRVVSVALCDEATVSGSPDLLRSAIENVVRNAARHTAPQTRVEVSLSCRDKWALVSVRDCGPGVPEQELSEVFRPFYRVGTSRERHSGGSGLGLAITARAVEWHGGTVVAHNAEGGGLVVEMRLPLHRPGTSPPNSASRAGERAR